MGFLNAAVITSEEKRAIDEAVKADPWAFIEGVASSEERPLSDLMDWVLAHQAEHESAANEAS